MIELKEITKDNLEAVLGLRVSESQKRLCPLQLVHWRKLMFMVKMHFLLPSTQIILGLDLLCLDIMKPRTNIQYGNF